MMKKILQKLSIFMICLVLLGGIFTLPAKSANAEASGVMVNSEIVDEMLQIVSDYSKYKSRIAGSDGEKRAAEYIRNYLADVLTPTNLGGAASEGWQTFRFTSAFDGKQYDSQNISFSYTASKKTNQKVIIGCSYDNIAFDENLKTVDSEGINGSAGSVATLLALAKYIPKFAPEYNIDFVFFGAGESNNAGSVYYTNGISADDSKDILLMINIDKVAIGKNLYFYCDEIDNSFTRFASKVSSLNQLTAKKIDLVHLSKVLLSEPNEIGLEYTHIAQVANNINFMKVGVLSMNLFAGDYEKGVVVGRAEYEGKDVVTYTTNDSLSYIAKTFGSSVVAENLSNTYSFVQRILTDKNFVATCVAAAHETDSFYSAYTNQKLIIYLTVLAFIIAVVVAMIIYYKLTVRAYYANVDMQFADSVLSITENLGESITSAEVPKAVSQMLASDIKKDKRIKRKKKKDDDK